MRILQSPGLSTGCGAPILQNPARDWVQPSLLSVGCVSRTLDDDVRPPFQPATELVAFDSMVHTLAN